MHSGDSAPRTVAAAVVGNTYTYRGIGTHAARAHTRMLNTLNMQVLHTYFFICNQLHVLSGF